MGGVPDYENGGEVCCVLIYWVLFLFIDFVVILWILISIILLCTGQRSQDAHGGQNRIGLWIDAERLSRAASFVALEWSWADHHALAAKCEYRTLAKDHRWLLVWSIEICGAIRNCVEKGKACWKCITILNGKYQTEPEYWYRVLCMRLHYRSFAKEVWGFAWWKVTPHDDKT